MTDSDKEVLYAWERISFLLKGKEKFHMILKQKLFIGICIVK